MYLKVGILVGAAVILLALLWWVKWLMKNRVADVKKEDLFYTGLIVIAACAWIVFFCGDVPDTEFSEGVVMTCPAPKIYAAHLFVCSVPDEVNLRITCESAENIVKQENIPVTIYSDMWWRDEGEVGCSEIQRIHSVSYPRIRFDVDEPRINYVVSKMSVLSDEAGFVECTVGFDYGMKIQVLEYLAYNPIKKNCSSGWMLIRNTTFIEAGKGECVRYKIEELGADIEQYLSREESRFRYWSLGSKVWKRMYHEGRYN